MSVQDTLKAYELALNERDIDAILALYDDAPVFMPPHSPAHIGRRSVRSAHEQLLAGVALKLRFDLQEFEEAGDWAWARASSSGTLEVLASGAQKSEGHNQLFVLRRQAAVWKIHRYLFSTNRQCV